MKNQRERNTEEQHSTTKYILLKTYSYYTYILYCHLKKITTLTETHKLVNKMTTGLGGVLLTLTTTLVALRLLAFTARTEVISNNCRVEDLGFYSGSKLSISYIDFSLDKLHPRTIPREKRHFQSGERQT